MKAAALALQIPPVPPDLVEPELSPNAQEILKGRYLLRDENRNLVETPRELFWRVAWAVAQAERKWGADDSRAMFWAREFYTLMAACKVMPNSPTLMNAGTRRGLLSACFVLPIRDSLTDGEASIYGTLQDMATIHHSGGGTGFDFSALRPESDVVQGSGGVASGPVSFLSLYDKSTEEIKQGGKRRGANMAILRCDHPDVVKFITCKDAENKNIANFNISVAVTDGFMEALERDGEWRAVNPRSGKPDSFAVFEETPGGWVWKRAESVKAKWLWDLLVKHAWRTGDPGLFFVDRANRSPCNAFSGNEGAPYKIVATNPCVTGDAWVQTAAGPRQVRDLVGVPFVARVNGRDGPSGPEGFFKTGTKPVLRLRTREGHWLRLTADHRVRRVVRSTRDRVEAEWCEAGRLRPGDRVLLNDHRAADRWEGPHTFGEGYLAGLLVGDGTLKSDAAVLSAWRPALSAGVDTMMASALEFAREMPHRSDFTGWHPIQGRNEFRLKLSALRSLAGELGMEPGRKAVTEAVERCSSWFCRGFLRGFFDTDGSVQGTRRKGVSVRLAQSDLPRLEAAQRMLLRLGVASRLYKNRRAASTSELPDGRGSRKEYPTRPQHELVVSGENLARFAEVVGFADADKAGRLTRALDGYRRALNRERFTARVESVAPDGVEDVYDARVPGAHAFDANGLVVHNCGEQPLLPYESCNLGHVNLAKFVTNGKSNGNGHSVDWDSLKATVQTLTRFLDDVVEVNRYPIPQIDAVSRGTRRIGLGVMGFADMLVALHAPYDSEEGRRLAERLMEFVTYHTLWTSSDLAKERGRFPWWEKSVFAKGHSFAEHLPDGRMDWTALDRKIAQDGLANSNVTTVAPTGTTAEIAGCEGQGCEPFFSLAYRRVTPQFNLVHVNPHFRKAVEGLPGGQRLIQEVEKTGILSALPADVQAMLPERLKRLFTTANEISVEGHVKMLAAWTRYVSSAISKTINLPNSATEEDVDRSYRLAWEAGCRNITVFRDGCKSVQVLYHGSQGVVQHGSDEFTIAPEYFGKVRMVSRPKNLVGTTYEIEAFPNRNLYVTVNEVDGKPFEVFCRLGDSGTDEDGAMQAVGKLASGLLRAGVSLDVAIKMLRNIKTQEHWLPADDNRFMDSAGSAIRKVHSPYHALALVLEYHLGRKSAKETGEPVTVTAAPKSVKGGCPLCGAAVTLHGGCQKCSSILCEWQGPCG